MIISLILSGLSIPTNEPGPVGQRLDPNAPYTHEQIAENPKVLSVFKGCAKGMAGYIVGEADDKEKASDPQIAKQVADTVDKYCTTFVTKFRNAGNMVRTPNPERDGCRDSVIAFQRSTKVLIYHWNPNADLYCDVKLDPKQTVAVAQKTEQ